MPDMIIEIFNAFTKRKWENWISDILYELPAYPVNKLHTQGDVLEDVYRLLEGNNKPTILYEQAIKSHLLRIKDKPNEVNYIKINRLLNVIAITKSASYKKALLEIFTNRNWLVNDKVVMELLYALRKTPSLSEKDTHLIRDYYTSILLPISSINVDLLNEYFSFVQSRIGLPDYFKILTQLLVSHKDANEAVTKRFMFVIMNSLEEAHHSYKPFFYQQIYSWIARDSYLFRNNQLYNNVIQDLYEMLSTPFFLKDEQTPHSKESYYAKTVKAILIMEYSSEIATKDSKNQIIREGLKVAKMMNEKNEWIESQNSSHIKKNINKRRIIPGNIGSLKENFRNMLNTEPK